MVDGPQPFGNAAGGHFGDLAYPTGGHYLPLPSPESVHVREILFDLGIISATLRREADLRRALRAARAGGAAAVQRRWQEGFIPTDGVPAEELAEHRRFFAEVERLRALRGRDGRRMFVFPTVQSSSDPEFARSTRITLKQWLERRTATARRPCTGT
jgi:hypothetical protein